MVAAHERLNGEIKRCTDVVGSLLLDRNDEWALQSALQHSPKQVTITASAYLLSQSDKCSCQAGDDDPPNASAEASYIMPPNTIGLIRLDAIFSTVHEQRLPRLHRKTFTVRSSPALNPDDLSALASKATT